MAVAKKRKALKKGARKVLKGTRKTAKKTKAKRGPRVPQKKGTYRVRLRHGAVRALDLSDSRAAKLGLNIIGKTKKITTYEGGKGAFTTLRKEMRKFEGDTRPEGAQPSGVWAVRRAAVRIDKALTAGAFAGEEGSAMASAPAKARKAPARPAKGKAPAKAAKRARRPLRRRQAQPAAAPEEAPSTAVETS
jgi:hypothetical protein